MGTKWDREKAKNMLTAVTGVEFLNESQKSAQFRFVAPSGDRRELDLRDIEEGITIYANQISISGRRYSDGQIEGITVEKRYPKGLRGKNGNPGIAARVAKLPSLNPLNNEVMLIHANGPKAFSDFVAWYQANGADTPKSNDDSWDVPDLGSIPRLGFHTGRNEKKNYELTGIDPFAGTPE